MFNQEYLQTLLDYNPETGEVRWKERVPHKSEDPVKVAEWNKLYAGTLVYNKHNRNCYITIKINKQTFPLHRVIWVWMYNTIPNIIDHINGVRNDNRLCNLRDVDKSTNARNKQLSKRNTSGYPGVSYNKSKFKWIAQIQGTHLGHFNTFEEAKEARRKAESERNYHPNHGRLISDK